MSESIHLESPFERYISHKLTGLTTSDGWRISKDDSGFDPNTALYLPDFIEYVTAIAPEKVQKMKTSYRDNWQHNLELALTKSLENNGTVATLREGFQMAGFQTIVCSGHYPDDPRLPKLKAQYDANILRVMHQVHYQTAGNKSLDLVFFINGIPVATAEVKTDLTQSVYDAIKEYQTERKPIEPGTRRKNNLLMFRRGAVVHFAISESEIWMCTNLETAKPKFLPFNIGNDGHAGNPPMDADCGEYPTGYFWNLICKKNNWLKIFQNFIFEEDCQKEDATGKLVKYQIQLFPPFHQWDVVTKVIHDVKTNGVGQRYLIEHSAGSGKTETISWVAHELIRLMNPDGTRLFSSVIVVTDRIGLDNNIKNTIKQLKKTVGLIEMVGGDGSTKTNKAKSKQLATALKEKREIIVVTLQTFPFAMEAIVGEKTLEGAKCAVVIDEAHSSQGGSVSGKMKAALKMASDKICNPKAKRQSDDDITDEDAINAYFTMCQANNVMPDNVSFFAFTATPKAETKTTFGRPGTQLDKDGNPLPESFHLYPMRQAIEEGYILDVLQGYMPYKTAYKLKEDIVPDKVVDVKTAVRTIAHWESLHPTNVMEKAEFIIEHFVKNVASMLDGQAKAMIVTPSRAAVIRYKYAIDGYLRAHPEYNADNVAEHLQFKVPGEPLVAFSGKITGDKCIMDEDAHVMSEHDYLRDNPFALIKRDFEYTEENINNIGLKTIENAFEDPKKRFLIVANKFQTGFNQPKLCAMYIDKRISNDIEIVQTYSRLNRTHAGKDKVFIIDFVNDPETVVRAFKKYDKGAEMEKAQDLNVIYDIKKALDEAQIYDVADIQTYKKVRYEAIVAIGENKDSYRKMLYKSVAKPAERWLNQYNELQHRYADCMDVVERAKINGDKESLKIASGNLDDVTDELNHLLDFRKNLGRYRRVYNFISQIIELGEPDLEVFNGFAKLLAHKIEGTTLDEIDIKNLVLSDYAIKRLGTPEAVEEAAKLRPISKGSSSKSVRKESLREIISKMNEIWGELVDPVSGAITINAIADIVAADDVTREQIHNETNVKDAVIAEGRLESIIKLAASKLNSEEYSALASKIMDDPQTWKPLAEIIFDLVSGKKRIDLPELKAVYAEQKR